MTTTWRPHPTIRPIAIGIVRRGEEILAVAVTDDSGAVRGWRPPGGAIEFGERAAAALERELVEELGCAIAEPRLVTVLENLYEHHGARGHEIVFVFDAVFADAGDYLREAFHFEDANVACTARWIDCARFRTGAEQLFPIGLIEAL